MASQWLLIERKKRRKHSEKVELLLMFTGSNIFWSFSVTLENRLKGFVLDDCNSNLQLALAWNQLVLTGNALCFVLLCAVVTIILSLPLSELLWEVSINISTKWQESHSYRTLALWGQRQFSTLLKQQAVLYVAPATMELTEQELRRFCPLFFLLSLFCSPFHPPCRCVTSTPLGWLETLTTCSVFRDFLAVKVLWRHHGAVLTGGKGSIVCLPQSRHTVMWLRRHWLCVILI